MELTKGDLLKSNSGDWHEVLKIDGKGYVQCTNGFFSVQSRNEAESRSIIYIFDGRFMNRYSIEEIDRLYIERRSANDRIEGFMRELKRVSEPINASLWYINPNNIIMLLSKFPNI